MAEDEIIFCPVDKITKQTPDEFLLRFNTPINHDPGQFMQCSVLGIGEAPISICSYDKDYFELSIRDVGSVSHALVSLKEGDLMGLRGPYGRGYEMDQFEGREIILIGGGCGVAPLRGIVEYLEYNRDKFTTVRFFFGFRSKREVLFGEDFDRWQSQKMSVDVAYSEKAPARSHKGYVTDLLPDEFPKSDLEPVFFLCGPPVMIEAAAKALLGLMVKPAQIWVSEERHMKCGVGRCGHCMIKGKYCCKDGPVFRWDEL